MLIETTGLADPAPIAALFLNNPLVAHDYRLDAIVATVDAVHGGRQLAEHPESVKQAAIADRLLVTKSDLAEAGALRARLEALNPGAALFEVVNGEVDPELLFGAGPFDPAGRSEKARAWLAAERYDDHAHGHAHHHDTDITSVSLVAEAPLDWDRFQRWLGALRRAHADQLLRVKGILNVAGEEWPLVVHGVHDVFHPPVLLARWPDDDRRSRLVIIMRGLDRAAVEAGWRDVAVAT